MNESPELLFPITPTYSAQPEFHVFDVQGQLYAFEANSLAFWKLSSLQDLDELKKTVTSTIKPQFMLSVPRCPRAFVLEATHRCPLSCDYCFLKHYYKDQRSHMSFEVAKEFLDKYALTDNIMLGFFGGEPLLNMDLISRIVDYVKGKFRHCSLSVTTNGVLLTHKFNGSTIAQFLIKNGFSSIISLDGPPEVHNQHRIYANGKGSFDDVMAGLEAIRFSDLAKRTTLRGTFTSDILSSKYSLKDRVEFLTNLVYVGYASHMSLEPVCLTENSCISSKDQLAIFSDDKIMKGLEEQYFEATDWFISEINSGRRPVWHQITKFTERLLYAVHSGSECGAGKGYLSCGPDGSLYACHREMNSYIGNLKEGIDQELLAKWMDNRIYARKGCMSCNIRYLCGGGCRECSIGEYNDITKPLKFECDLRQIWVKCALKIIHSCPNIKNVIRNPRLGKYRCRN